MVNGWRSCRKLKINSVLYEEIEIFANSNWTVRCYGSKITSGRKLSYSS